MDVGLQLVFSAYGWEGIADRQVYEEELRLALLAEELGFDALWPVEHHFFDYALCPDNTQLLSYLAACTERIDLGTAAVIMPWDGPHYPQPRREIRPRPSRSFKDRLYAVAGSNDSVDSAARLGARMVMFAERQWDHRLPGIERYRKGYQEIYGVEAPPPMTADFMYCDSDGERAVERATQYMGTYLASLLEHYELMNDHFADTKGYQGYNQNALRLREIGESGFLRGFLKANAFGTPDQILTTLEKRRAALGPFEQATCFRFGVVPFDEAERGMRLFAKEVLPVLHGWDQS